MREFDVIVPFVRDLLTDELRVPWRQAPASNMIRQLLCAVGRPFTRHSVATLEPAQIKELGTIIVATYDTTALT